MRALNPLWKTALAEGVLDVADNPAAIAFLVSRANDAELAKLPRVEPVLSALLARHGASDDERRAALAELAALSKSTAAAELVRAMRDVDAHGDKKVTGDHARHVQHALGALLLEAVTKSKEGVARGELVALADSARLPETAAFARAACVTLDGGAEKSWQEIAADPRRRIALLGALERLPGPLADADFARVRALALERAGDAAASAP